MIDDNENYSTPHAGVSFIFCQRLVGSLNLLGVQYVHAVD